MNHQCMMLIELLNSNNKFKKTLIKVRSSNSNMFKEVKKLDNFLIKKKFKQFKLIKSKH